MSFQTSANTYRWSRFEECNTDTTTAFENMCRILFKKKFVDENTLLVSAPNNPGIEVEPVLEKNTGERISFQAKYFSTMNYNKIRESMLTTITYYDGKIDKVYLYCNKDISVTSQSYEEIKALLESHNISIVPITNQELLAQVAEFPIVSSLFFQQHNLSEEWFDNNFNTVADTLGPRYNRDFNVETEAGKLLDIFLLTENGIASLNETKNNWIDSLQVYSEKCFDSSILLAIKSKWEDIVDYSLNTNIDTWRESISSVQEFIIPLIVKALDEINKSDVSKTDEKIRNQKINNLYSLKSFAEQNLFEFEGQLITNQVLCLCGEAGSGKTQLMAHTVNSLLRNKSAAVLCTGGSYLESRKIEEQIMSYLGLDYSFEDFVCVLEGLDVLNNSYSYIFIDAINESTNIEVWKNGLVSITNAISRFKHIKFVFSLRSGYENLILCDNIKTKIDNNEICQIIHRGFETNATDAIKQFFNYYNIPFQSSDFLRSELTNPLFLKLYCENKPEKNCDIFTLFDTLIKNSNAEICTYLNQPSDDNLVRSLLFELGEIMLKHGRFFVRTDLYGLSFWDTYGLTSQKLKFVSLLEKNGIIIRSAYWGEEKYSLGYNLLEDYICAKIIINKFPDKDSLKMYVYDELLAIRDGAIQKYTNIEVFICVCSLYAEKYHEECIDIIDSVTEKIDIVEPYIKSFAVRKAEAINSAFFKDYIVRNQKYYDFKVLMEVLIDNSIKANHPLNVEFLHDFFIKQTLPVRDIIWTTYINGCWNEDNRIYQIVDFYWSGESLDISEEQTKLLLILFTWLLTSSNRMLRDGVSKAMIEILKQDFSLCKPLLEEFESINDPYVIQRLYGIVFGACMKRRNKEENLFHDLAHYTYKTIFLQDKVYPDILLRDYAKLIIERYCYEYPDNSKDIDIYLITPPYHSDRIPIIEKCEDYDKADWNGIRAIATSMSPDIKGHYYGDFGRYVFQSAIMEFGNIDMENIYRYAMHYICNDLGYKDEYFARYDRQLNGGSRHDEKKVERIGKKYQWIAMYNILARLSDEYPITDTWENKSHEYCGAWEPFVRDFDPTVNMRIVPQPIPVCFVSKNEDTTLNFIPVSSDIQEIDSWLNKTPPLYEKYKEYFIGVADDTSEWVALCLYDTITNSANNERKYGQGDQHIWHMAHGYFIKKNELKSITKWLNTKNYMGRRFPEATDYYQLFNREFTWSDSYENLSFSSWVSVDSSIGEETDANGTVWEVMPAYMEYTWEKGYDASQSNTISFQIPCKEIIDYFSLEQGEYDGFFYDAKGVLVAFDGRLNQCSSGIVIRRDYLNQFLEGNDYALFWICLGEKQFFLGAPEKQRYSEWGGVFQYHKNRITGKITNRQDKPPLIQ